VKTGREHRDVEELLQGLRQVPPPDRERQAEHRVQFVNRAQAYRRARDMARPERPGVVTRRSSHSRRWAMVGLLLAVVLAMTAGGAGVIYAADSAVPGELLYGIDRAVEQARLSLARDAEARMELWLSFAQERLEEALDLEQRGDQHNLPAARAGYEEAISSATQEVGAEPHPVAAWLAEAYGLPYEQIMDWFLEGYGFGEIVHALKTGEKTGVPAEELLALSDELGGWGEVWQELGLIGRPEGVPAGRPEGVPAGPPEGVPAGRPEGVPAGRPKGVPAGPPEGVPAGRPEGAEPPDDDPEACAAADPHPFAERLVEDYGVSYEQIMDWFCEGGYGFGEIKLALETSLRTGMTAEELLALKTELGGWGEVWLELGLIGPSRGAPAGPPEGVPAGPPEGVPVGPPEGVPDGPPEGVPDGPPEGVPDGPPEGVPDGPPEGVPDGPPEGVPDGPPEGVPDGPPEGVPIGPPAGIP
jgi:hypothetical protein